MTKFVCKNCNFRFDSLSSQADKCPYCGGTKVIREPSAEDLLQED